MNVASKKIWNTLLFLRDSEGLLFVRKEYAAMYTRLVNAARRKQGPPGVVVSGQPGIGRSLRLNSDSGTQ